MIKLFLLKFILAALGGWAILALF